MPGKRRDYEELDDINLPDLVAERVEAAIALAERQLKDAVAVGISKVER